MRPNSTLSTTFSHGNRAPSWNTIISSGPVVVIGLPSNSISPSSGAESPAAILRKVDFPKDERSQISNRYLDMMQLTKFADSYTFQLSTGMKQRVAIARALAMDPDVLLMDEPFASLDAQTRDLLLVELQLIWEKTKKTIIFVTHNVAEAVVLGNKVLVMKHRPSLIKKEISIEYRRPRLIEDENLMKYQKEILAELRPEVTGKTSEE